MVLKEQELLQIDEKFLQQLLDKDPNALVGLSVQLSNDLKEALERLNQNPTNSSRPSSSLAPWDKGRSDPDEKESTEDDESIPIEKNDDSTTEEPADEDDSDNKKKTDEQDSSSEKRKAGKQRGSQGFGRTQRLEITAIEHHHCDDCPICKTDLSSVEKSYTGFQTVDIIYGDVDSPGIQFTNTQHFYYAGKCPHCGLESRSEPARAAANNTDWKEVGLTEWRLIGPSLAAMIVYLSMDMYLTRRKIKRFLDDLFGLEISTGTIQNCIVESARALAPVEEQLVEELLNESLLHADETSHKEAGVLLWLWVFITATTALFFIGYRSKEIFNNLLVSCSSTFDGWLMSDGYLVYRDYPKRLRCWAHLIRKARGLCESYTEEIRAYGNQMNEHLESLMDAIYKAREGPNEGKVSILGTHKALLEKLKALCEEMSESSHKKTSELGKEFLNDWDAIFRILDYPLWPLTNNEAERALRHWVIFRKITQGTRSEQGSRALALFASVITTCRLRNSSPLLYIRDVIQLRRQGQDVPKLPLIPA
jgi:IS1 family transposase